MNKAIYFAFAIVTLDMIGIGIAIPVLPQLLQELTGLAPEQTAGIGGYLGSAYAVMQFLFGAFLGNLSDRFGRKPILVFSLSMMAIDYLIMLSAQTLLWLFIGRFLSGISGATISTSFAIASDVSAPKDKAKAMGLISAGFGLGFIIGPALGGLLGEFFGPRSPFIASMIFAALAALLVGFFFKETNPLENHRPLSWHRANPVGGIGRIFKLKKLMPLFLAFLLSEISGFVYPAIWSFFVIAAFGWGAGMIGLSLVVVGIFSVVAQAGLIGPVQKRLGDWGTTVLGIAMMGLAMLFISLNKSDVIIWGLIALTALGGLWKPALQSILSNNTNKDAQGELQGILSALSAIAMIITPLAATQLFKFFISDKAPIIFPGAPLLTAAFVAFCALVLLIITKRAHSPLGKKHKST